MGLRVATYNLYLGADVQQLFAVRDPAELARTVDAVYAQLIKTDFATRVDAIAQVLVRARADLVALQEAASWTRRRGGTTEVWSDFLRLLLEALDRVGAPYDAHAVITNFEGGAPVGQEWVGVLGSNVILVRRGSEVEVVAERTGRFQNPLRVPTGIAGLAFTIARSWGWLDVVVDGARCRFVNTHAEAYDASTRDADRDELLGQVGDPGVPVLIAGDFNAPPGRVGMPLGYADAWLAAGGGPDSGFTFGQAADLANDESSMRERIDYVFVRDAQVSSADVVGADQGDRSASGLWPSDHAAVVAEVELARPD